MDGVGKRRRMALVWVRLGGVVGEERGSGQGLRGVAVDDDAMERVIDNPA